MTMILGINLSDRHYISGDTRLSYLKDGEFLLRHDNMQKVEYLAGANVKQTTIACAGDVAMAKYILNNLRQASFVKDGAATIRNKIEAWLRPVVDNYFTTHGYSEATFIIGGSDDKSQKIIDGTMWRKLANSYVDGKGPIYVNKAVQEVIAVGEPIPDGKIALNINDMKLFAVQISQANGIIITDTRWGEFLLYGQSAGLIRQDLTPKEIGTLEFGVHLASDTRDGQDVALISGVVLSLARKHELATVGGAVLTFQNYYNGSTYIITGRGLLYDVKDLDRLKRAEPVEPLAISEITVDNNRFYRIVNGTRHRLRPVSQYKTHSDAKLYL